MSGVLGSDSSCSCAGSPQFDPTPRLSPEVYDDRDDESDMEDGCPECGGEMVCVRIAPVMKCAVCGFTEPL